MLVPALHELGCGVVLAQTRGTSFCAHMAECTEYEVDTVATDGSVQTARLPVAAPATAERPYPVPGAWVTSRRTARKTT